MYIEWGDIATWVTGITSIALFIIAFLQIRNERTLRKKNEREQEIKIIWDQAEHISSWIVLEDMNGLWVAILNALNQPVYNLIVNVVVVDQYGMYCGDAPNGKACVAVAPNGKGFIQISADYHGMFRRPGVEIAFRDSKRRNWIRKTDGDLTEIKETTVEYYKIDLPVYWQQLLPDIPHNNQQT